MSTVTKRTDLLAGKAPRVDRYEGRACSVPSCGRACRALSRYCTRHASQHYRTRNPLGRMPRRKETNPWRKRAEFAMDAYALGNHPAIVAAEQTLERMVANSGSLPPRYAKHWRRLHEGGATGRAMLLNILAVYGWGYVGMPDRGGVDDALFFSALGSRFLRTVPVGWYYTASGKREQVRLPGLDCETVGRGLADKVGGLALSFWQAEEREHNARAWEALSIREALEAHPL